MKFTPLNTFVVAKAKAAESKTSSGIILSGTTTDYYTVVAKSKLVDFVDVGDTIFFNPRLALQIDAEHYSVDAKDIVTKIKE